MEDKKTATISVFEHDFEMYKARRNMKRLIAVLIFALIASLIAVGVLVLNHEMWDNHARTIEAFQSESE